jgi:hypothetical protein
MFRNIVPLLIAGVSLALMAQSPPAAQSPPVSQQPAVATPPTTQPATVQEAVKAIQSAEEPTDAVRLYLDAQDRYPNDPGLMKAYVHRLVELGTPESASLAAEQVVRTDPEDGLAWSVVAHMALERNDLASAVPAVQQALRTQADYPFVIITAAHTVALFDSQKTLDAAQDPQLISAITGVRTQLGNNGLFEETHARALTMLRRTQQANPSTVAGPPGPTQVPGSPVVVMPRGDQPDQIITDVPYPYDNDNDYGTPGYYGGYSPDYGYLSVPELYSYYGGYYYPYPFRWSGGPYYNGYQGWGNWAWNSCGDGWCATPWGTPFFGTSFVFTNLSNRHFFDRDDFRHFGHGRFDHGRFDHGRFDRDDFHHFGFRFKDRDHFEHFGSHHSGNAFVSRGHDSFGNARHDQFASRSFNRSFADHSRGGAWNDGTRMGTGRFGGRQTLGQPGTAQRQVSPSLMTQGPPVMNGSGNNQIRNRDMRFRQPTLSPSPRGATTGRISPAPGGSSLNPRGPAMSRGGRMPAPSGPAVRGSAGGFRGGSHGGGFHGGSPGGGFHGGSMAHSGGGGFHGGGGGGHGGGGGGHGGGGGRR